MVRDFAFTFYPGDYLRDTQCLSEKPQVAYDRIMCEHMRNIIISPDRLDFFTKRLNAEEKQELASVLLAVPGGFQIKWIVDSIGKSMAYRESRSKNRSGKKKDMNNISTSQDNHRKTEDEIVIENINTEGGMGETPADQVLIGPKLIVVFKEAFPEYFIDHSKDLPAAFQIAKNIAAMKGWSEESVSNGRQADIEKEWRHMVAFARDHTWYKEKSIPFIENKFQDFIQAYHGNKGTKSGKSSSRGGYTNGVDPTAIEREGVGTL